MSSRCVHGVPEPFWGKPLALSLGRSDTMQANTKEMSETGRHKKQLDEVARGGEDRIAERERYGRETEEIRTAL